MQMPRLGTTKRRIAALIVLGAVAVGVWLLLSDGEGAGPEAPEQAAEPKPDRPEPVSKDPIVSEMTVEEQVDQVLLVGFDGTSPDAEIAAELGDRQLGGVLVRAENWTSTDDGRRLVSALADAAESSEPGAGDAASKSGDRIPPLFVASQEGGEYRSFPNVPPAERALDIGREGSADRAEAWALEASRTLSSLGFHRNLFPVADVATLDSPVAGRAFADDSALVAELTQAALEGCDDGGLACAPLHFPGLGAASQDTADGPATVSLDAGALTSRDLEPFRAAAAEKAPAIVLSLALYPAFDSIVPAALAPAVATDLLRGEVGFRGVAISDDLGAGAVKATYSVPDAAVAALGAGVDLIQVGSPDDQQGVANALVEAVESGEVPAERLAQAAERVLDLKRDLGLVE